MTTRFPKSNYHHCTMDDIVGYIEAIDPVAYDETRNSLDGAVTWLSPFLSHGIIDTIDVATPLLKRHDPKTCYRMLFELGWREYFHRVWQLHSDNIFHDMRKPQVRVDSQALPRACADASTGIQSVDEALRQLAQRGLMHNHARLWVAAIICNMTHTHWVEPARWLHYQLLDGDLASNTLSWQWVAGTFSHKCYVANQQNINRYSNSQQQNSWLDVPYEAFENFMAPEHLLQRTEFHYAPLPGDIPNIRKLDGPVALRSVWNLNPRWQPERTRHVVFVDEAMHAQWPMNENRWSFIRHWAQKCNAILVKGSLEQLHAACTSADVVRQEYSACQEWPGKVEPRKWLYSLPESDFNSFSQYFKLVKQGVGL